MSMEAIEGWICETMTMHAPREPCADHGVDTPCLVDFFCGCGGTSAGFRAAGARVLAGIDNDRSSGLTFARNFPEALFIGSDIKNVAFADLEDVVGSAGSSPLVFSACAPCQPFSKQRRGPRKDDAKAPLLLELMRFVRHFMPTCIFIENVPGMQRGLNSEFPLQEFESSITDLGYFMTIKIISSAQYGIPQRRLRLVALASLLDAIDIPKPTHGPGTDTPNYSTVREWIGDLPPLEAGEKHSTIPNHRAAGLSDLNLKRIRATPEGGSRTDWPDDLLPPCHSNGYDGHTDVYGRMAWDAPATGLTTRCISYSNGRFGHPDPGQDRAISVREAACLQTFPRDFIFEGNWESMGRQIGNAVPVRLAQVFGAHIAEHIAERAGRDKA